MDDADTLYGVLGVEAHASAEDIRKSFRKLALQWHPDKQRQQKGESCDSQQALEKFREINNAYEILSNEKERQWYDSRLRRLQKKAGSVSVSEKKNAPQDFLDIASVLFERNYMSGTFDDSAYAALFRKISRLENDEYPDYEDSNEPIQVFYAEWGSFASRLSFAWVQNDVDLLKVDRKVRRVIEQENAKARKNARKEYNESVRFFSEFVKRRDPRYQQWYASKKEEEKREADRLSALKMERELEKKKKGFKDVKPLETDKADLENTEDTVDFIEEEHDVWYCPACEKYFKSKGSFNNHEKSKKHIKNVELMKQMLLLEDEDFCCISDNDVSDVTQVSNVADGQKTTCRANDSEENVEEGDLVQRNYSSKKSGQNFLEENTDIQKHRQEHDAQEKKEVQIKNKKSRRRAVERKKSEKLGIGSDIGKKSCSICKAEFESRNQLFAHIRDTGHAALKT